MAVLGPAQRFRFGGRIERGLRAVTFDNRLADEERSRNQRHQKANNAAINKRTPRVIASLG